MRFKIKIKIDVYSEAKSNRCERIFGPNTVTLEMIGCILINIDQSDVGSPGAVVNMNL